MRKDTPLERLYNGIIKENPTFVMMLGMCPTLAVTTSAKNGIGMGLATMVILTASNLMISLLRKIIPDGVRMPAYIVVVASFVTIVEFLMEGFIPALYSALGIYIPLIVVNCIILGRAEAYAGKHGPIPSLFDGIGMGLGFTVGLTLIGMFRELIGAGTLFGIQVMPSAYEPVNISSWRRVHSLCWQCSLRCRTASNARSQRKPENRQSRQKRPAVWHAPIRHTARL